MELAVALQRHNNGGRESFDRGAHHNDLLITVEHQNINLDEIFMSHYSRVLL